MHANLAVVWLFAVMDVQLTVDDLQTVTRELLAVAERWKAIGCALQLNMTKFEDELQQLHGSRTHRSAEDYLSEMLREWIECATAKPTWCSIVGALRSPAIGEMKLALFLESKYCTAAPLTWKPEDTGGSSS